MDSFKELGTYDSDIAHALQAYILHDRAGTLASLLCPSVCLTVSPVTQLCLYGSTWNLHNTIAMSSGMCKFVSKGL